LVLRGFVAADVEEGVREDRAEFGEDVVEDRKSVV